MAIPTALVAVAAVLACDHEASAQAPVADVAAVGDRSLVREPGREASAPTDEPEETRPSPLEVDYAQYGAALAGEVPVFPGEVCPDAAVVPCILGPGAGPVLRGGYRPSGPWYFGGAYQFAKLDSNNLYRLGIMQMLRAEGRYFIDVGSRFTPYVTWALGGVVYGNEFGVETGGAVTYLGAGVELEITRFAVVGLSFDYEPMLLAGFSDSAGQERNTGVAHFLHMELVIELRTELGRE
ncbi:MAG: hypothetical protein JNK04_05560 [Myxococcales bacterium]|nr:hypothetical protein [Myxococcales bacterium]